MTTRFVVLYAVTGIAGGFFLMAPLAWLFESMRWPYFHGWGLAHGGFIVAWPALSLLSLAVVAVIGRRVRRGRG